MKTGMKNRLAPASVSAVNADQPHKRILSGRMVALAGAS